MKYEISKGEGENILIMQYIGTSIIARASFHGTRVESHGNHFILWDKGSYVGHFWID